jgi:hypothetical protein
VTGRILHSPQSAEIDGPLIFLAGPIQGARDWQIEAAEIISHLDPSIWVASPRRRGPEANVDWTGDEFYKQVDWETRHLELAAADGVILFWLQKEDEHICERAFAQTTRFELGEYCARARLAATRVVVGIDSGFTNARYIRYRLQKESRIPICEYLAETCIQAVSMAQCYQL